MLQLAYDWLATMVDVSLKSLLLATLAGLTMRLLGIRDANLRHRVWTAVLSGMLAMPALVLVTPSIPLPGWITFHWPVGQPPQSELLVEGPSEDHALDTAPARGTLVAESPPSVPESWGAVSFPSVVTDTPTAREATQIETLAAQDATPFEQAAPETALAAVKTNQPPEIVAAQSTLADHWPIAMVGLYLVVFSFLFARMLIGLLLARRLVRVSRPVDLQSDLVRGRPISVCESNRISVPLTIGCLRAVVILPMAWRDWSPQKLQAVLAHELAHVRRGDWLVTMLAEANRACYWFHPLSWLLKRWLSALAEQNCDDAVLAANPDRAAYARHLLEVASSLTAAGARYRAPLSSVAMARIPTVETRINAILDSSRPLARRLSAIGMAILLGVGVPAVIFAAALRPASPSAAPGSDETDTARPKATIDLGDLSDGTKLDVEATSQMFVVANVEEHPAAPESAAIAGESAKQTTPFRYEGQVLTPEGQPAANVELHLVYWYSYQDRGDVGKSVARTDEDGNFRFEMSRGDFHRTGDSVPPWQWASLVAVAEGYGCTWAPSWAFEKTGAVLQEMRDSSHLAAGSSRVDEILQRHGGPLRLVRDDVPIRGRIVDTEGQPIVGARIRLLELYTGEDNTLDAWLRAARQTSAGFYSVRDKVPNHLYGPLVRHLIRPVTTDDEGRFTLRGVGRERLLRLLVEAPNVEWTDFYCRTRPGEPLELGGGEYEQAIVHGPSLSHVTTPSKPIVGVVRDKKTGKPLSGVRVSSRGMRLMIAPGEAMRAGNDFAHAVTDEEGRYELVGLPRSEHNRVEFLPSEKQALLPAQNQVDTSGLDVEPVELNAELGRGVEITGRVTDQRGQGVSGQLAYLPARKQGTTAGDSPRLAGDGMTRADMEGRFRTVVPHGKGYLAFTAFSDVFQKSFARPADAAPAAYFFSAVRPSSAGATGEFHGLETLDLAQEVKTQRVTMQVSRAPLVKGTIVDLEGKPLRGGQYQGRSEHSAWRPMDDGAFVIAAYDPAWPRRLTFVHREKKLAGTRVVLGEVKEPLRIALRPWGEVTGRVVDAQGDAVADLLIFSGSTTKMMRAAPKVDPGDQAAGETLLPLPLPPGENIYDSRIRTDAEGRFRIEGLVPGEKYDLSGFQQSGFEARQSGDLALDLVVEPGETRDLGDVELKQPDLEALRRAAEEQAKQARERAATEAAERKGEAEAKDQDKDEDEKDADATAAELQLQPTRVTGTVRAPDGTPVESARLYWLFAETPTPRALSDVALRQVATTDKQGSFTADVSFANYPRTRGSLVAIAAGYGLAWEEIERGTEPKEMQLQLVEDHPIHGRILNTEGQPVQDATLEFEGVFASSSGSLDAMLVAWKREWQSATMKIDRRLHLPLAQILGVQPSDAEGRFEIRGLGKERAIWTRISSPNMAASAVFFVNREGFDPHPYNKAASQPGGFVMSARRTLKLHGPRAELVVEAAKVIAGRVTLAGTEEPVPRVTVSASAGYSNVSAVTDAQGRYRLVGVPKHDEEMLLSFWHHPDSALLPRTLAVKQTPGLQPMQLDVELRKGVILSGRLTEAQTGQGVIAGIRVAPLPENEYADLPGYDHYKRSRVMQSVDAEGRFRFATIPGPGVIVVQAYGDELRIDGLPVKPYKQGAFTDEERERVTLRPDDEGFIAHGNAYESMQNAVKVIDIPEDAEHFRCDLTVDRGLSLEVSIRDDEDRPLEGATVCGMTESWPITFTAHQATCTIYALDPKKPRRVIFYHPQRRLTATLTLRGDETPMPIVRLKPAKTLVGRAVDASGEPLAGATVDFAWSDDTAREFQRQLNMTRHAVHTDDEGNFRVEGVLPGVFRLVFRRGTQRFSSTSNWEDLRTVAATALPFADEIQLGDIPVKPR